MKQHDLDFHPESLEEESRRAEEEQLARRVRREVMRIQRGEAEEDLAADREAEEAEQRAAEMERLKAARRAANPIFRLLSGTILVSRGVARNYPYLLTIAGMFFLNIVVLFWSLHLDLRYTRLERSVQKLREQSIRLEERRYRLTTHSAVAEELARRGIALEDPTQPIEIIE
ncbi:MAG: hypothetical protein IKZ12_01635 [Alistipes sp.]|nr:hypothetical protein [Alistipes sp.]MBR5849751.1 hypothetical protein [Alistipes sp.]